MRPADRGADVAAFATFVCLVILTAMVASL